jgi:hypothetical protein
MEDALMASVWDLHKKTKRVKRINNADKTISSGT